MNIDSIGNIRQQRHRNLGPLLFGLLILAGIAAVALPLYFGRMMMGPPQTVQQLALPSPGTSMSTVLEVTSLPTHILFEGILLQKNNSGSYSRTPQHVSVRWNPSHAVIMGSSSDVKIDAILQVYGTLGTHNMLIASQIVILTGTVQMQ